MNIAKFVLDLVKTDHKMQLGIAAIALAFGCLFIVSFGEFIGLERNIKLLIASALSVIACLISFFATEKSKTLYMFMCGFLSAVFLMELVSLLGYSW